MKNKIYLVLLLLTTFAHGAVVLTANQPAAGWTAYPNDSREFMVGIAGGTLNTGVWSVQSGTATLEAATCGAQLATCNVTMGATTGTCTINGTVGSGGPFTVTSGTNIVIRFTSNDDATQHIDFPIAICAESPEVHVFPFYVQMFPGQTKNLTAEVRYSHDKTGVWSITSQPGGGDGTLSDTTFEDAVFTATVAGRYVITYTSNNTVAGTQTGTGIVYVTSGAMPSYGPTGPEGNEVVPCEVDPAMTGTVYDVGPSQATYHTLSSAFTIGTPPTAGSTIRIHNEASGTGSTTYFEYVQLLTIGTPTQPLYVCAVPNALGYLPTEDATNSTGNAGIDMRGAFPYGLYSPFIQSFGTFQGGSGGPAYIVTSGLHFQVGTYNTTLGYAPGSPTIVSAVRSSNVVTLTMSGPSQVYGGKGILVSGITGTATTMNGTFLASGFSGTTITYPDTGPNESGVVTSAVVQYYFEVYDVNARTGDHLSFIGNHFDHSGVGLFTDDNQNDAWSPISQDTYIEGNMCENYGDSTSLDHCFYLQSYGVVMERNHIGAVNTSIGAIASAIKWRGVYGKFRYNYIETGPLRPFDGVADEDGYFYHSMDNYFGCCWNAGDTMGANKLTGWQGDFFNSDLFYGNLLNVQSAQTQIHYMSDKGQSIASRQGQLSVYNNTFIDPLQIFDTVDNGYTGPTLYLQPRFYAANNSWWTNIANGIGFFTETTSVGLWHTNFANSTSYFNTSGAPTTPITGCNYNAGSGCGWSNTCYGACFWPGSIPIDNHQVNLTSSDWLAASTSPLNGTTFAPLSGSLLVGTGSALSGEPSHNPVRNQWCISCNRAIPRTRFLNSATPLDIGALDAPATVPPATPFLGNFRAKGKFITK